MNRFHDVRKSSNVLFRAFFIVAVLGFPSVDAKPQSPSSSGRPIRVWLESNKSTYAVEEPIFFRFSVENLLDKPFFLGVSRRFWRLEVYKMDGSTSPASFEMNFRLADYLARDEFAPLPSGQARSTSWINILNLDGRFTTDFAGIENRFNSLAPGRYAAVVGYDSPAFPLQMDDRSPLSPIEESGGGWPWTGEAASPPVLFTVKPITAGASLSESTDAFDRLMRSAPPGWTLNAVREKQAPKGWLGPKTCVQGIFQETPPSPVVPGADPDPDRFILWACSASWPGWPRPDPYRAETEGARRVGSNSRISLFAAETERKFDWPGLGDDLTSLVQLQPIAPDLQ